MAPVATSDDTITASATKNSDLQSKLQQLGLTTQPSFKLPPAGTLARYKAAGIDISQGYPYIPPGKELFVEDIEAIRTDLREYVDPASRADPEKKALFGAATKVTNLTVNIGTEIEGLQLKDLTDQQKDELALLIAERTVVFFRNQSISPQAQKSLGEYLGHGEIEYHPQAPQVPGIGGGVSLIWNEGRVDKFAIGRSKRLPYGQDGAFGWHTDLVHEAFPPGYTHLHQDTVPETGGDTLWASGYAAYDKLSPKFQSLIDGLNGIYRSAHTYKSSTDPTGDARHALRVHPLVRTNKATGWKGLFVNRAMTVGIEGLDKREGEAILNHIYDVYERSTDIQVRFHWTPGTSALWDNRASIHTVSFDYDGERHGTRVSSLAEKPYFDPESKSKAQALGLKGW